MLNFDRDRYARIAPAFEDWWAHRLERPIIQVTLTQSKAGDDFFASNYRKEILTACYDFDRSPAQAAEDIDRAYSGVAFLGDAFPVFYMRPTGVLSGYLGQRYSFDPAHGTVWFYDFGEGLDGAKRLRPDPENPLLVRSLAITRAVQDRFEGRVAVGVPDFGGVFDILSSACNPNELLADLCEEEEAVTEAAWRISDMMMDALARFNAAIDPEKIPGYTCWATMLSQRPYYVLQNDFSAMIGSGMYDDYYLPILRRECKAIPRTIYHLDGPGAVRHLDSILTVEELDGVQWINGAGAPGLDKWPDIYRKIRAAGKLCQVFINGADELGYIDDVIRLFGSEKDLCFICTGDLSDQDRFAKVLDRFGIPV